MFFSKLTYTSAQPKEGFSIPLVTVSTYVEHRFVLLSHPGELYKTPGRHVRLRQGRLYMDGFLIPTILARISRLVSSDMVSDCLAAQHRNGVYSWHMHWPKGGTIGR